MGRFQRCTKCVVAFSAICISLFIVGVVLLIVGFLNYMSVTAPPPYMWSLNLCPTAVENHWVGYPPATIGAECPDASTLDNNAKYPQTFDVSPNVLGESIPYSVMVYITNKVNGNITLDHYLGKNRALSIDANFNDYDYAKTDFAYCGGKKMNIFRNGELNEDDGDYITYDCQNQTHGCEYEPARSLTSYNLETSLGGNTQILHMTGVGDGSYFIVTVNAIIPSDPSSSGSKKNKFTPEVYIEYKVAGRGPEQDSGLILMIIGGVFADLMPATLYFLLQKYYYKNPSIEEKLQNQEDTGIPLMNLDDK